MCDECHQNPCVNTCPNNPNFYVKHYKTCPICLKEYDEEDMDYAVCDDCLQKNKTYEIAQRYGADRKMSVMVNGFYWFLFDAHAINRILAVEACGEKHNDVTLLTDDVPKFFNDDLGDFADWLKEKKGTI